MTSFVDLGVPSALSAALTAQGITAPFPIQTATLPDSLAGRDVLGRGRTGSGKTLTAFMTAIDALVREGLASGLPDTTLVLYVSPLKALSNDIHINLEAPLAGIREALTAQALPDVDIRTAVRTGDTPQSERVAMRKRPPHILVPADPCTCARLQSGRPCWAGRTVILAKSKAGRESAAATWRCRWSAGPLTGLRANAWGFRHPKPSSGGASFLTGSGGRLAIGRGHVASATSRECTGAFGVR